MRGLDLHRVFRYSVVSEKSHRLSQATPRTYVFVVHPSATKFMIRHLLEHTFDVQVESVRTCVYGERQVQKRRRYKRAPLLIRFPKHKKAYVTLKSGELPDVFKVLEEKQRQDQELQEALQNLDAKQLAKDYSGNTEKAGQ